MKCIVTQFLLGRNLSLSRYLKVNTGKADIFTRVDNGSLRAARWQWHFVCSTFVSIWHSASAVRDVWVEKQKGMRIFPLSPTHSVLCWDWIEPRSVAASCVAFASNSECWRLTVVVCLLFIFWDAIYFQRLEIARRGMGKNSRRLGEEKSIRMYGAARQPKVRSHTFSTKTDQCTLAVSVSLFANPLILPSVNNIFLFYSRYAFIVLIVMKIYWKATLFFHIYLLKQLYTILLSQ